MATTHRTRDAAAAKAAILRAAEALFAERGFAATSIRDVAEASGTSKALIHHHFGSKDELYLAVKRAVIERHAEVQRPQLERGTDPLEFVAGGIRTLFELYRSDPSLVRLGAWAQLDGTGAEWPGDEELWGAIVDRMREAQEAGVIRADIDATLLITMGFAMVHHWCQFRAWRKHVLEYFPEQDEEALDDRYLEAVLAVFIRGITPAGQSEENDPAARAGRREA
ncbi:MAG TPA: TetR/AcrR family transcriptional regulator [Planctomycetaceae bacterium]|nr:TetR/AcrR family transcriptional regulator [Planctomycetaceae bacterium]HIQ19950.1 TetR/AcrR family transcriptional regulator [Planctomycetota bacterium]